MYFLYYKYIPSPIIINNNFKYQKNQYNIIIIITLPLRTALASANSDCGIIPFSVPNVFTTFESPDGIESPWEFSARTKKTYEVAGFNSLIYIYIYINEKKIKWHNFIYYYILYSICVETCINIKHVFI